ncbi:pseudouridine synthase [Delitschia confertaspora ATCC 74209]|uniref:tRNA pseudouridine(55) synthase n=1 Tax=Delitschia confertaspora ATCC 74209 TaxID=1513339 RepID=A0A9P4JNI0_9PLEO|nr:pseudouridine synthase [Delitschia confertaspora ATCC 74209]
MTSPPHPPSKGSRKIVEGIFAINKPTDISSAGVLRTLQDHFDPSSLFTPWLTRERQRLLDADARPRNIRNLKVKLGHGGTLDPLATGVLVVGVGKGTKCLSRFLECTKTYECTVLFGAATDSYDCLGKVVGKAPYEHITREKVEETLGKFRGKIMQKPSIFSALKVDGKKMYEYARAGGEVPEVQAREVGVEELEMLEWYEPGTHNFEWPKEEVDSEQKAGAEKLMGVKGAREMVDGVKEEPGQVAKEGSEQILKDEPEQSAKEERGVKRERDEDDSWADGIVTVSPSAPKKLRTGDDVSMSGALQSEESSAEEKPDSNPQHNQTSVPDQPKPTPPAARLRMTVTSGFYVRSLCHDLGLALSSFGLMSTLIRTRQGAYSLSKNVLEYSDLEKGEEVWGPQVEKWLEEFMEQEGWEEETVGEEEVEEYRRVVESGNRGERGGEQRGGGKRGGGSKNWRGKGRGGGRGKDWRNKGANRQEDKSG